MIEQPLLVLAPASTFEDRIELLRRELELAVQWARPCLLLVVYGSESVLSSAQLALEQSLKDIGQRIVRQKIQDKNSDQVASLLTGFRKSESAVLWMDGMKWSHGKPAMMWKMLNAQRDHLAASQIRAVLWLTPREAIDLAHYAPDLWAECHRVIEFSATLPRRETSPDSLQTAWADWGSPATGAADDPEVDSRQAAIAEDPAERRADRLLTLGMLSWRKGENESAGNYLRDAIAAASEAQDKWTEAECFNAMALVETSTGRVDQAIEAYKQALQLAPRSVPAWNNLGRLFTRVSRHEDAAQAFMKAIEANPRDPAAWTGLGNVHLSRGEPDHAAAAYRKATRYMPDFGQAWNGLGDAFAAAGRIDDAVTAFRKAIDLDGKYMTPRLHLARLLASQRRYEEASTEYQQALELDPQNAAAWRDRGAVLLELGNDEQAIANLRTATDLDVRDGEAHSLLALALSRQGKYAEAVPVYRKSLELLSGDKTAVWDRLQDAYRMLDDYEQAIGDGDRELAPLADGSESLNETAAPALSDASPGLFIGEPASNQLSGMEPEFASLVQDSQGDTDTELHVAAENMGRPPETIAEHEGESAMDIQRPAAVPARHAAALGNRAAPAAELDGAKLEADSASAWNARGNALFRQGAVGEAVEAYNRSIKLNPTFGWPYGNLALAYLAQGQFAEALHLYQKSLELLQTDEERAVSWNGLGNVYRCVNDYANAVAAYQKAAELDPATAGMRDGTDYLQTGQDMNSAKAWNELGEAFLKSGAFHEALRAFRKAVDLQPEVGWPYMNLAGVLAALGQHAKAVPFYQKALALLPGEKEKALVWNRLGNAHRKLNDYESAMKAYQQAVVLADEGQTVLSRARFSLLSNLAPE